MVHEMTRSAFSAFKSYQMPSAQGRFGRFGGQFAPETLMPALQELIDAYDS